LILFVSTGCLHVLLASSTMLQCRVSRIRGWRPSNLHPFGVDVLGHHLPPRDGASFVIPFLGARNLIIELDVSRLPQPGQLLISPICFRTEGIPRIFFCVRVYAFFTPFSLHPLLCLFFIPPLSFGESKEALPQNSSSPQVRLANGPSIFHWAAPRSDVALFLRFVLPGGKSRWFGASRVVGLAFFDPLG